MKEYLYATLTSVLVLISIDILISKSKNGKVVKSVLALVVTTMLAVPVVSLITGKGSYSLDFSSEYFEYLTELEDENLKSKIKTAIYEKGIEVKSVTFEKENGKIVKVFIKIENEVILDGNGHINIITERVYSVIKSDGVEIIVET